MAIVHDIVYAPGPVATRFHQDIFSRVKLLIGPFGTGKTTSCGWDLIDFASEMVLPHPRDGIKYTKFAVVRNTYPELVETTIRTYHEWFPPGLMGHYTDSKKTHILEWDDRDSGGSHRVIEIIFKALDTEKSIRDLLSLELTGFHIDEAREVNNGIFRGLMGRRGRYPSRKDWKALGQDVDPFVISPQGILSTNFPDREHWLYRDFVAKPKPGYTIYKQGQDENRHNLRVGYYEEMAQDYADRPDLLRTLVLGDWGITVKGKAVYENEWNNEYHVADEPLLPYVIAGLLARGEHAQVIRGWDNTGLNPACAITYINTLGQWLIFKEFTGEDVGAVQLGEEVKAWCKATFPAGTRYTDIADPAGKARDSKKGSATQYMRTELGISVIDGLQNFKVRRETVAKLLRRNIQKEPAILVDPGCIRLVGAFDGGYAYKEIGTTGKFSDEPDKNKYSHIMEAVQYAASRTFNQGEGEHDNEDYEPEPEPEE